MGNSVNGNPVKLMPPGTDSSQKRWNFVMYDSENLTLTMSAEQGQSGQSLTFQYNGTGGPHHYLAYVLEQDGVPVYYGKAASLKDSGTGTVTVPLLGVGSKLEDGDYTMRFYEEDRTDGIYFASDTVDLEIRVADGAVSITNMGDVAVHTHSFGTGWESDESGHWHECSCGARSAEAAHVYDNDLDAECNVCTFKREISHVHQGVLVSGTPATCTADGVKEYYECSVCHQYFEDADCTNPIADLDSWKVIPAGHTWSDSYLEANANEGKHYHVCTVCGAKDEGEAHTWNANAATETHDKHCTICGYVAEEQLEPTHTYGTEWKSDADTHWHECSCGEKADIAAHSYDNDQDSTCNVCRYERQPPHTHDFGNSWESDAFGHWQECSCGEKTTAQAHSYDDEQDPICNVCGYERELSHTHDFGTDWESDAFNHWHKCSTCGAKDAEAAHSYGDDQDTTCNICGYVRPAAPEYTVTFNANGGSVSPSSAVTTDGKLRALPIPTRSGYDFVGWYTTASGGDRVTVNTVFTKNTTIYAYWEKQSGGGGDDPIILPSKTPSEEVREDIENAQEGDTVEVTLKPGKTELGGEVFEELAGKNITLEITVPGGVMWMVNGQDIPTDTDLTDIDMGVSMNTSTIPVDLINMVTGEMGAVQMTLAHDGEFGFTMTLTAPVGVENKGLWANLYHYDATSKRMLFETVAQVDASGNVALKLSHASEYAIVLDEKSHELPFTDTTKGTWYQGAVEYVYRNGIMTGTSATTFQPNGTLSRAMAVQIFYNLEGQPDISDENLGYPYEDVNAQAWYGDAVYWARLTGVATGYGDGTFQPGDSITRQEFAQMLYNYAKHKGYDLTAAGDLSTFPDSNTVADWAEIAMEWANGNGLINGHDDGTIDAAGAGTRAQAASILMRFDQNLVEM